MRKPFGKSLLQRIQRNGRRIKSLSGSRPTFGPLQVETLEQRAQPATFTWVAPNGVGNWSAVTNWDTDNDPNTANTLLPTADDDAGFSMATPMTVTLGSDATADAVSVTGPLTIKDGTLNATSVTGNVTNLDHATLALNGAADFAGTNITIENDSSLTGAINLVGKVSVTSSKLYNGNEFENATFGAPSDFDWIDVGIVRYRTP